MFFQSVKRNIVQYIYINGVHWQKQEDKKSITIFIKFIASENVLHCFYNYAKDAWLAM